MPRALDPEQEQREAIARALAGAPTDDAGEGIGSLGPKNSGLGHYGDALGGWDDFERRLLAADPLVTGPLSPQTVRKVAHTGRGQLRYCFQVDVFDRHLDLKGDVTVKFEVSPAGRVSAAEVTQSTIGNAELESCVAGRVRTWSFPRRGGATTVTYAFRFEL
jgi:TonB family protein